MVIRQIDEKHSSLISSGQVISDLRSVLKELIENAIDADATEVLVSINNFGMESITVTDNGKGFPPLESEDGKNCSPLLQRASSKADGHIQYKGNTKMSAIATKDSLSHPQKNNLRNEHSTTMTKKSFGDFLSIGEGIANSDDKNDNNDNKSENSIDNTSDNLNIDDNNSLGFRGEALFSLSQLADVVVETLSDADIVAASLAGATEWRTITHVITNTAEATAKAAENSSWRRSTVGTTIYVYNIFKRYPVRLKQYEKNKKRQLLVALSLLKCIVVAHANVRLVVEHRWSDKSNINNTKNDSSSSSMIKNNSYAKLLATSGLGDPRNAISEVFGSRVACGLDEFFFSNVLGGDFYHKENDNKKDREDESNQLLLNNNNIIINGDNEYDDNTEGVTVNGYISQIGKGRASDDIQIVILDGRVITLSKLAGAITGIYQDASANAESRVIPAFVCFIKTNGILKVDANFTPDKSRVLVEDVDKLIQATAERLSKLLLKSANNAPLLRDASVKGQGYKAENVSSQRAFSALRKAERSSVGIVRDSVQLDAFLTRTSEGEFSEFSSPGDKESKESMPLNDLSSKNDNNNNNNNNNNNKHIVGKSQDIFTSLALDLNHLNSKRGSVMAANGGIRLPSSSLDKTEKGWAKRAREENTDDQENEKKEDDEEKVNKIHSVMMTSGEKNTNKNEENAQVKTKGSDGKEFMHSVVRHFLLQQQGVCHVNDLKDDLNINGPSHSLEPPLEVETVYDHFYCPCPHHCNSFQGSPDSSFFSHSVAETSTNNTKCHYCPSCNGNSLISSQQSSSSSQHRHIVNQASVLFLFDLNPTVTQGGSPVSLSDWFIDRNKDDIIGSSSDEQKKKNNNNKDGMDRNNVSLLSATDVVASAPPTDISKQTDSQLNALITRDSFEKMVVIGQFNQGFILVKVSNSGTVAVKKEINEHRPETETTFSNNKNYNDIKQKSKRVPADQLFIIDQHAADEKHNYERLLKKHIMRSQPLLQPVVVCMDEHEMELALEHKETLFHEHGFGIQENRISFADDSQMNTEQSRASSSPQKQQEKAELNTQKNKIFGLQQQKSSQSSFSPSVFVTSIPVLQYESIQSSDILELTQQLVTYGKVIRPLKAYWHSMATKACRMSIMIGRTLDLLTMSRIVRRLGTLDHPWACPHGRPTIRFLGLVAK